MKSSYDGVPGMRPPMRGSSSTVVIKREAESSLDRLLGVVALTEERAVTSCWVRGTWGSRTPHSQRHDRRRSATADISNMRTRVDPGERAATGASPPRWPPSRSRPGGARPDVEEVVTDDRVGDTSGKTRFRRHDWFRYGTLIRKDLRAAVPNTGTGSSPRSPPPGLRALAGQRRGAPSRRARRRTR